MVDKGEVVSVEGWRFRQDDRVAGESEWKASTRVKKQQGDPRNRQRQQEEGRGQQEEQAETRPKTGGGPFAGGNAGRWPTA